MIGEIRDARDGRHRHQGVADRAPGVQHAAHQLGGQRPDAAGRHGRGPLPDRRDDAAGGGPAAGAAAVRPLPQAAAADRGRGHRAGQPAGGRARRSTSRRDACTAPTAALWAGWDCSRCCPSTSPSRGAIAEGADEGEIVRLARGPAARGRSPWLRSRRCPRPRSLSRGDW